MTTYTLTFAAAATHTPTSPDRTAQRDEGFDVAYRVWPSRRALVRAVRAQGRRPAHPRDWTPIVAVRDEEKR